MEHISNREWVGDSADAIAIPRVSTGKQKDNSPKVQLTEIERYCGAMGLNLVKSITVVESAKDHEDRKKYQAAIQTAIREKIRHVIFYMTDREGRNFTDIEYNQKLIKKGTIVVHYVKENKFLWHKSSRADFMLRDFQALQDKALSLTISEKVSDAMRDKAVKGWYPGNHVPLGYVHHRDVDEFGQVKLRGTTISRDPNDHKVKIVIREFELYAEAYSVAAIRKQIIDEGLIVPSGLKKYSKRGIESRIKNPFYRGRFVWQGIEYKGRHELIIPPEILQKIDDRRGQHKFHRKPSMERGIFSGGFLRCADPECGLQIVYEGAKKKSRLTGVVTEHRYCRCSNSRGVHKSMRGMYVKEEDILKQFEPALDLLSISRQRAKEISEAIRELNQTSKSVIEKDVEQYGIALESLQERRSRFADLLADGDISKEDYRIKIQEIDVDMRHYTRLTAEAQTKISDTWNASIDSVLELANQAKELWKMGTALEKVEIMKKLCWNPLLDGATLRYNLKKPYVILGEMNESENWRTKADNTQSNSNP